MGPSRHARSDTLCTKWTIRSLQEVWKRGVDSLEEVGGVEREME